MKIVFYSIGEITVIRLAGGLDSSSAAEARQKLSPVMKKGGKFILDLTDVEYTFSAGLVMLISSYRDIANSGGKMALVHPQDSVLQVLEMAGVPNAIPIYDDLDSAVAELNK